MKSFELGKTYAEDDAPQRVNKKIKKNFKNFKKL